jgi:HAD superfamily hydrolase (TIGR01450 family)
MGEGVNEMATRRGSELGSCDHPLWSVYDVAMLDLDGVVYIGPDAVPGAADHLAAAAEAGMALAYVTNNASRTPRTVAAHLVELGMPAAPDDVVTSAQAAARLVADAVEPGSAVFVIGGDGLFDALEEQALRPVQRFAEESAAVVSGYHPDLRWKTVIDGAILVRNGVPWFASNTDMSVPTPHGPGPGNGVLVEAVARFAGVDPVVAGKPEPPLFHETQRRVGGRRPLVVGDRLDTDIEGAVRAGYDSLLVMTGVTGLPELVAAEPGRRPTYVSTTLAGIGVAREAPVEDDGGWVRPGAGGRVGGPRGGGGGGGPR